VDNVRALLDAGMLPFYVDSSAEQVAVHVGRVLSTERSSRLVARSGAEVNARDGQSRTALHAAAGNGHIETLALLFDRGMALTVSHSSRFAWFLRYRHAPHVPRGGC
jgi:ankyrin repeat protein